MVLICSFMRRLTGERERERERERKREREREREGERGRREKGEARLLKHSTSCCCPLY